LSLRSSSLSFTRFVIADIPKTLSFAEIAKLLNSKSLKESYLVESESELDYGWIKPDSIAKIAADEGGGVRWEDCRISDNFIIGFRVIRRRVQPRLIQMIYRQRLKDQLKAKENLGRSEKKALLEEIGKELLRRALPQIQDIEIVWNLRDHSFNIYSTSQTTIDFVAEVFHSTFYKKVGARLQPRLPVGLTAVVDEMKEQRISPLNMKPLMGAHFEAGLTLS
jgi:DNA recombination-dependent growth factor C